MTFLARLKTIWDSDHTTIAINALSIAFALDAINGVIRRRTEALEQVNKQIVARKAELAALEAPLSPAPAGTYPAREDLTPLSAGEVSG